MREQQIIDNTPTPNTQSSLEKEMIRLGMTEGMTIIVHSSLSSLGWVSGGSNSVVNALINVIGSTGNIIMPTHSVDVSNPDGWYAPSVPPKWLPIIKESLPAFDPKTTPTFNMGAIVNNFLLHEGVRRSYHPTYSFACWGKDKDFILNSHPLNYGMGVDSPLDKIYKLDGYVLLLGTDYSSNSSMHLGEELSNSIKVVTNSSPILKDDKRIWKTFKEVDYDSDKFNEIGNAFEKNKGKVKTNYIGNAQCKLMKQREIVDFTSTYIKNNY
ncbi:MULTISPECIES: aminoglycoside N(3)-acetyltransferase [Staphylococcus]|uniref:aminoglycoside N(3)-acetyltransferase n=1 Tax=Staphylococcus TaxID=1279 RepID=UPI000E67780A|nr:MULTISPECIES: AAC(3) family N-acetyltransferase [Staphylococcus]RIO69640.1 aminoglycoside N(3)-acetyltransferase [Staphylococcus borealis]